MPEVPAVIVAGGTVVDESGGRRADVLCQDGLILAVEEAVSVPRGAKILDASGCIVSPGLVDLHTHLREPGAEDSECVESGARSGALGGYTALTAMPNTDPPIDTAAVAVEVLSLGSGAVCQVGVAGAITVAREGERLAPIGELAELGIRIFTDDGRGVQDAGVMRRALEYARGLEQRGLPVVLAQHCEDLALLGGGLMNEGPWSSRLGLPGAPAEAEEVMVARDIALSRLTAGRVHFLHLSTGRSAAMVRDAKAEGLAVTAEVTPHHLTFSDAELATYDSLFKVSPPLRSGRDVTILRNACYDGTVDAVATDHAPHRSEAKETTLEEAASGMIGLETALCAAMSALCSGVPEFDDSGTHHRSLTMRQLLGLFCWVPARIAGISTSQGGGQGGPVASGIPANLCVIDPDATWVADPEHFASRSRNSPWAGRKMTGRVRHTIYRGEPVVVDAEAQR